MQAEPQADAAPADRFSIRRDRQLPPAWQLAANMWMLLLFTYLVVLPAGLLHIGLPLFAVTGVAGVLIWLVRIDTGLRDIRTVILGFGLAGSLPVAIGVLNSTPGWRDVAAPLVGGPMLWYFASHLLDLRGVRRVPIAVGAGTIVVSVFILALVTKTGEGVVQFLVPEAFGFVSDGEARTNYTGVSALIATVPFLAVLVFDQYRFTSSLRRHKFIVFALLIGLGGVLLSGRQGVVGAAVLVPVLMLVTSGLGFSPPRNGDRTAARWKLMGGSVLIVGIGLTIASVAGVDPARLPNDLLGAAGLTNGGNERVERGSNVRSAQADSLITGWRERPWIGGGAGDVAPDFFTWRGYELGTEFTSTSRPWRAELSYHLLLFESGLAGVGAYLLAFAIGARRLARRYSLLAPRDQILCRAAIVSALSIAVATAANPIARAVGHQWPLFFPIFVIAVATQGRSEEQVENAPVTRSDVPVESGRETNHGVDGLEVLLDDVTRVDAALQPVFDPGNDLHDSE